MITYAAYEDLRQAFRFIAGNRILSAAVFLSLTLGIGASVSMFGAVDAFLFRPLPVPQTDRILQITSSTESNALGLTSYPDFADLQKRTTVFESLATTQELGAAIDTHGRTGSRITFGLLVSGEFFRTMRVRPAVGRDFRPDEDQTPARDAVAMISYGMWQRDFAGSSDVIGKTIQVNRKELTIIGVVPPSFTGANPLLHPDFYVPRMMAEVVDDPGTHFLTDRNVRVAEVYGRMKPGVTLENARAEIARVAAQLERENPVTNRGRLMGVYTQIGFRIAGDPGIFTVALLFLLIGALVLVIACVNVGNLLLSTAPARTRETALRLAMGATRARLIGQFTVESLLLSATATAAGLGVAAVVSHFVRSIEIGAGLLPVWLDMHVDTRVAFFAFGVGMAAGILAGLIPALRCSQGDLDQLMRSANPRVARSRTSLRQILVGAQVAFATVVLVLSGLALESLSLLKKTNPGFRVDNLFAMGFDSTLGRGLPVAESHRFYDQVLERVRKVPGVEAAAFGHHIPLGLLGNQSDVIIEGYAMPEGQHALSISSTIVGEGYFDTLAIPLVRGRAFDVHDTDVTPDAVIINEAMAEKYWPGRDPIGARIEIRTPKVRSAQIVGIARTAKYRSFDERSLPFMYLPLAQSEESFVYLFVATKGDPASFISIVRDAVRGIAPNQPIYDVRTMTDVVRKQALWSDTLTAQIATGVGLAGLFLGVLGLYAMLAYLVSQRTREIGIRMAVGATSARVSWMIVLQGLKWSVGGIVGGIILSSVLASAIPDTFAPADFQDPMVYGAVVVVLLTITLLSCYQPARRAARIDPNECLRCE